MVELTAEQADKLARFILEKGQNLDAFEMAARLWPDYMNSPQRETALRYLAHKYTEHVGIPFGAFNDDARNLIYNSISKIIIERNLQ